MFKLGIQKLYFWGKLYSFVYKMSIILKQNVFIFRLKNKQQQKHFEITYWNLTTFTAHAFLIDIVFARSSEQEQTGEENKGDKCSVDTIWHTDMLLVNKHEKQFAQCQLCCQPFFLCGGKPENLRE